MNQQPELWGLMVFSHGWSRILTVMSRQGASATLATVKEIDGVTLNAREGQLPQFRERRDGALQELIDKYGIVILDKAEWDRRKSELGETIYL
jgi:hypothetical protein